MNITTPSLLFPAISLLLLAYTNRFLALASLIRLLHQSDGAKTNNLVRRQIKNLKTRITLIKSMQALGVMSFLICTLCMFTIFLELKLVSELLFGTSILMLALSLLFSLYEISISTEALKIELEDLENG